MSIRAVISDAFYEARNQGLTMESACDTAADAVARMIADAEQAAERRGAERPTVTTPHERDALPIGVVVRSAGGTIAARFDKDRGVVFGIGQPFPWRTLQLPLTVLWSEDQ